MPQRGKLVRSRMGPSEGVKREGWRGLNGEKIHAKEERSHRLESKVALAIMQM